MKNNKLVKEIKEFFSEKGIDNTQEKLLVWYGFAELQIKEDTYWSSCENCDNRGKEIKICAFIDKDLSQEAKQCDFYILKDDFPIWFCVDQK